MELKQSISICIPPVKPLLRSENTHWVEEEEHDSEGTQPVSTISQAMRLKENSEGNLINCCISNLDFPQHLVG